MIFRKNRLFIDNKSLVTKGQTSKTRNKYQRLYLPGVVTVVVEGTDCKEHSHAAVEFRDFAEEAHEEIGLVDQDLNEVQD